ncbi:MAG: C39 family peptidase [Anaerolineales bacterium]|nr:C39 family peptidase [Anaerolineales bacterium]
MATRNRNILIALAGLVLLGTALYLIPAIQPRVNWRVEKIVLYVKNAVNPPGPVPTSLPVTPAPVTATIPSQPLETSLPVETRQPTPTPVQLPGQVSLTSPPWEQQTPNNCGPATLSMAMHMYGWDGDQEVIAEEIKPVLQDRNVNPEEMVYYVRNFAGWLRAEYRVAGDIPLLKRLLAAHYPVIIEGTTSLDPNDALGPHDDLWAAHYLLLTGYDDAAQTFTVQDSYHGAGLTIDYDQFENEWEPFNYLYMLIYLPDEEEELKSLLGNDWDPDLNRQHALDNTRAATETDPGNSFAWFNLGSNLVYFERYDQAALAYDKSKELGLPMRMFRYQFGPFIAYFQSHRTDDLLVLTTYAKGVTEMSEEVWLWHGWGLYRQGDIKGAIANWNKALSIRPGYDDAEYALSFVQ